MKLSIIIVNYNTRELVSNALKSVSAHVKSEHEIIVVDNASVDNSVEHIRQHFPHVRLIASEKNLGFAAGNNVGFSQAKGEYVFFLNPDTLVEDQSVDKLLEYLQTHTNVGIVAPKLVYADGKLQRSIRPFYSFWASLFDNRFLNPIVAKYEVVHRLFPFVMNHHQDAAVDWVKGAAFMMPHALFKQLNGFDEQFWVYGEEMDLCKRVHNAGFQVHFKADTHIVHLEGQSTRQASEKMFIQNYRAFYQFLSKHYSASELNNYHKRVQLFARLYVLKAKITRNSGVEKTYKALLGWTKTEGLERVQSAYTSSLSGTKIHSSSGASRIRPSSVPL